ncbi:MAG: dephospho-CoA kinase [Arenimonas sp.]|jgi:dephospho-CoA kinase
MAGYVVAITGGIASGKSAVTGLFERLGIAVSDADAAARAAVEAGQPALAEIVARFGPSVLRADGGLDRARLRELIFSDAAAKHDLEAITHPRIRLMLRAQCLEAPGPYVVVAIPLLAESGSVAAYPWLQRILVVDTPIALQRARLVLRDGIDAGLAERMISAQASREQRLALATDVLVNDGALADLEAPVRRLDALYRQLASRSSPL